MLSILHFRFTTPFEDHKPVDDYPLPFLKSLRYQRFSSDQSSQVFFETVCRDAQNIESLSLIAATIDLVSDPSINEFTSLRYFRSDADGTEKYFDQWAYIVTRSPNPAVQKELKLY
jgi:hypothetical protein